MTARRQKRQPASLGATARLGGEPDKIATAEIVAFAESIVRGSVGQAFRPANVTVHLLGTATSTRVRGDAVCLAEGSNPVWRVSVSDETGVPMAEVVLSLASGRAGEPAEVVALEAPEPTDPDGRRAHIAKAARDVFAEKGYAIATMREVAAAAGMHVPTMYQYVRSKEEMLELVYDWTINRAVKGMEDVLSAAGTVPERMDRIVRRLHDVNQDLRRGTLVMNRETRSLSRPARDRILGRYAEMVARIADVIAEGQGQGIYRKMDPQLAAVFVDALADVWVLRPFAVGHSDYETYAAELAAFVRGALTEAAAPKPGDPGNTRKQQESEQ